MLKINGKECEVLSSEIKYVDVTYNMKKSYSILVLLDIKLNNNKGYISFYVDLFNDKDFKNIENKKYTELPDKLDSKITMIEIFDTKDFIDWVDGEVNLEFGNIVGDKIGMTLNINDSLIKLQYNGQLNIK